MLAPLLLNLAAGTPAPPPPPPPPEPTQAPAGSWDDEKKKKHTWYVQKGRRLYSFDNEEDALLVLNAPDAPKVQTPAQQVVKRAIAKAKTTTLPPQIEVPTSAQLLAQSKYEALQDAVRRWQDEDEEDVEMLLLA